MFTGGHCGGVGLGRFLLPGRTGLEQPSLGLGRENVVGIDVVTAEGEVVHALQDANTPSDSARRTPLSSRAACTSLR